MYLSRLTYNQLLFFNRVFKETSVSTVSEALDYFFTHYGIFCSIIRAKHGFNWSWFNLITGESHTDINVHVISTFNQAFEFLLCDLEANIKQS